MNTSPAAEGYFVLNWQSEADEPVELQQSRQPDFSDFSVFQVPATGQLTLTGFQDGAIYFRLSKNNISLTETLRVDVQHHSLTRATGFFVLGLSLLLILVVTLLMGNRRNAGNG